jgi:hypothetical protein
VWVEPSEAVLLRPPGRMRIGTDEHSWFAARPRPFLLGLGSVTIAAVLGVLAVHKLELAVAGLVAVGLVIAVLLRPLIGGLVLVGTVPILSGLAPGVPVAHVRASELIVGLVGVTVIASARSADALRWSSLDWLLLAYGLGWALFGALDAVTLHQSLNLTEWGTNLGQLQFFLIYRGVRISIRTQAERRLAMSALVLGAVPISLLALLQELHVTVVTRFLNSITGGLTAVMTAAIETGNTLRATGPFNNWAALAGYLLPILLVLVALGLSGQVGRHRRTAFAVGLCALIGLLVTIEISAIVILLLGVALLSRQYRLGRPVIRAVAVAMLLGALVAGPFMAPRLVAEFSGSPGTARHAGVPQTLAFRWNVWTGQYLPAIDARPLTGYGAQLPSSITWVYPESQYVSYLMEGGVPLLLLFGALGWVMVAKTREAARSEDPFDQALGRAAVVAVVGMLAMNLTWPFLSNGGMPQVLWCLLAVSVPRATRDAGSRFLALDRATSTIGGAS